MAQKHDVATQRLWELIEANAMLAQKHTKWDLYLTRIKVLVEMIEDRISRFERKPGDGPLLPEDVPCDEKKAGGESA